jgi:hypothetical protein
MDKSTFKWTFDGYVYVLDLDSDPIPGLKNILAIS